MAVGNPGASNNRGRTAYFPGGAGSSSTPITERLSDIQKAEKNQAELAAARETRLAMMREMEDSILERCCVIVNDALSFRDVQPGTSEEEAEAAQIWPELDSAERVRRLRIARCAWQPMNELPAGIRLAHTAMIGIAKARGQKATVAQQMNVQIRLPAPTSKEHPEHGEQYPVVDVE